MAPVEFADAPNLSVRLSLGGDTVAAMEAKYVTNAAILADWRQVSISIEFQSATRVPPRNRTTLTAAN